MDTLGGRIAANGAQGLGETSKGLKEISLVGIPPAVSDEQTDEALVGLGFALLGDFARNGPPQCRPKHEIAVAFTQTAPVRDLPAAQGISDLGFDLGRRLAEGKGVVVTRRICTLPQHPQ
jgi:hypothetical protein